MAAEPIYKVIFINPNQVFELFARQIYQSDLYGFIAVADYILGEPSPIVVDSAEARLKREVAGVKGRYIRMDASVRIDEIEKEGSVRIRDAKSSDGKVMTLPLPGLRPQFGAGSSEPHGDG